MTLTPVLSARSGLLAALTMTALLAGCSSVKLDDVPVESRTPSA